jgi:hypothetical protein
MSIDFKNKEIKGTRIQLTMIKERDNRPDDWSLENELALMSYMLQVKLMNLNLPGIHGSSKEHWRSNLMNFMNETLDKFENTGHLQYNFELFSDSVDSDFESEFISFGNNRIIAQAVCKDGDSIFTPEFNEMCKKENLRREAVAIAKQEIQDEQEAEREANTLSVVQPIKGYLKHDQ